MTNEDNSTDRFAQEMRQVLGDWQCEPDEAVGKALAAKAAKRQRARRLRILWPAAALAAAAAAALLLTIGTPQETIYVTAPGTDALAESSVPEGTPAEEAPEETAQAGTEEPDIYIIGQDTRGQDAPRKAVPQPSQARREGIPAADSRAQSRLKDASALLAAEADIRPKARTAGWTAAQERQQEGQPEEQEQYAFSSDDTAAGKTRLRGDLTAGLYCSPGSGPGSSTGSNSPMSIFEGFSAANQAPLLKMSHSVPVTYGVSFGYDFSRRWGVTAGIGYTLYKSSYGKGGITMSQKLHYISVPVNLRFNIVGGKVLSLYALAGGSFDKCVDGSISYNPDNTTPVTRRIGVSSLEYSVNAGAGLMVRFLPFAALYAEPMYTHYFNAPVKISSYRTDSPDAFTISVGLRFNF